MAHEIAELFESFLLFLEKRGGVKVNKISYDRCRDGNAGGGSCFRVELDDVSTDLNPPEVQADRCPVQLNVDSGDVISEGIRLCTLTINTLPFHYLKYLARQYPNATCYQIISRHLKESGLTINRKTEDRVGAQAFCFTLKRQIKMLSPRLASYIIHSKGRARIMVQRQLADYL